MHSVDTHYSDTQRSCVSNTPLRGNLTREPGAERASVAMRVRCCKSWRACVLSVAATCLNGVAMKA